MRILWTLLALLVAAPAAAQTDPNEGKIASEFRREGKELRDSCGTLTRKAISNCAAVIVMGHPAHFAFGNIAPQNGVGMGAALVLGQNRPSGNWRFTENADAVMSPSGAWRAGVYVKSVFSKRAVRNVGTGRHVAGPSPSSADREDPVINFYEQSTSLPKLAFYGIGPDSLRSDKTFFGLTEHILGASTVWRVDRAGSLNLALLAEANGRWASVRPGPAEAGVSIENRFDPSTAPQLNDQPSVMQFGEGVRVRPTLGSDRVRLDYTVSFKQFAGAGFQRWSVDLRHEIPLYRSTAAGPPRRAVEQYGPDDCGMSCKSVSRDREGFLNLRAYTSRSTVAAGQAVPFYFQETIGGSDVSGDLVLPGYDDYRFRGPHTLVFQESVEHSIAGPVGFLLGAEHGRVFLQHEALSARALRTSLLAGVTFRLGGFPLVSFTWAKGGSEGHHSSFSLNMSILGGSRRPALF